jgi:branched-chain amino acid transport system ATP-binding protein
VSLLEVQGLEVRHGQLPAIRDLDLSVEPGQILGVIGANGAGKSTLLRCLAGVLPAHRGSVVLDGQDVTRLPAHRRVAVGIAMVPEGRRLFPSLSVEENLLTGTYRARPGPWDVPSVMSLFPWMRDRRRQGAGVLSGGEQQAVAIGRALVSNPQVLLLDEVSLGLAPVVVHRIYQVLPRILDAGTSVLLVEQDVSQALRVADRVQCLLEGRVVLEGAPADLAPEDVEQAYFGLGARAEAGEHRIRWPHGRHEPHHDMAAGPGDVDDTTNPEATTNPDAATPSSSTGGTR